MERLSIPSLIFFSSPGLSLAASDLPACFTLIDLF
jgi:hypothetical protein